MLAPARGGGAALARSGSLKEQAVLLLYEYTQRSLGSTYCLVCCAMNHPGVRPTVPELIMLVVVKDTSFNKKKNLVPS